MGRDGSLQRVEGESGMVDMIKVHSVLVRKPHNGTRYFLQLKYANKVGSKNTKRDAFYETKTILSMWIESSRSQRHFHTNYPT